MSAEHDAARRMLDAIESVTRYASRGCSSMACDRARGAWMANQLSVIGREANALEPAVRSRLDGVPWERLQSFAGPTGASTMMTADEMQRFVERELPAISRQLKQLLLQERPATGPA